MTVTSQTINHLYLGSPVEYEFEGNASRLLPTDYKELLAQRQRMIEDFLEMRPKQYVQHWVQEIFRGAAVLRPSIVETVEEMISFVRQSRGRLGQIGYVFDTDMPPAGSPDIKVLLTIPLKDAPRPPSK